MSSEARKLSILIPLYNEEEYIAAVLDRVLVAPLPHLVSREIIVVDDGSEMVHQRLSNATQPDTQARFASSGMSAIKARAQPSVPQLSMRLASSVSFRMPTLNMIRVNTW